MAITELTIFSGLEVDFCSFPLIVEL